MWLQIHFVLMFSRQGKLRLQKWYEAASQVSGPCLLLLLLRRLLLWKT